MKPVVCIVGRANVGKSTLFNRLLKRKKAIIDDIPGVTRDRNYGEVKFGNREFTLVDTGGFEPYLKEKIFLQVVEQTKVAIEEADLILFLMDGKEGLTFTDFEVAKILRETKKPVLYLVNKVEGKREKANLPEFYGLGFPTLLPISAKYGEGVGELLDEITKFLPAPISDTEEEAKIRVAVVGRPNVGKSSLVNQVLGYERVLVSEEPGTTRDSIDTLLELNGKSYLLIDTAGIRRKSRIGLRLEKYCVFSALKSIDRSDVVLLLIDATEGITDQDQKIASFVEEKGKACILIINKWDLIPKDNTPLMEYRKVVKKDSLKFLEYAPIVFLSVLEGKKMPEVLSLIDEVFSHYENRIPTSRLNELLMEMVEKHPFPAKKNIKLLYITQALVKPPTFIIFSNHPKEIPPSYERYILNQIRKNFDFGGTPLRILFRKRT